MGYVSIAKKIGIIFLILVLLILLAIAALPFWMPWVAGPVLKKFGVTYDSYERVGYARFALLEVDYSHERVQVQAERVEAFIATGWLWERWRDGDDRDYAAASDWRVEILEAEEEADAPPGIEAEEEREVSVFEMAEQIEEIVQAVIDWAPRARLGSGELVIGERIIEVRGAVWKEGVISAEIFDGVLQQVAIVEGDVSGGLPFVFHGRTDPFPLALEITVSRVEAGLAVAGEADFAGNRLVADAEFPREGYWPDRAHLRSDEFRIPSEYLRIEGYEDIAGNLLVEWREGHFTAEIFGEAEPLTDEETWLPPLRVDAAARGDLESFLVESLEIRSPWLAATLSDPVAMDYRGNLLTESSVFELAADLAAQPFANVQGSVRGKVEIFPGEDQLPLVRFQLMGDGLAGFEVELDRVELSGNLQWPDLAVTDLVIDGSEETRMTASADLDLDAMAVTGGRAKGAIRPELVARWLPDDASFSTLDLDLTFDGPFQDLRHQGVVRVESLVLPPTYPMDGTFAWEGRMASLLDFGLELLAGSGRLALEGSSELEAENLRLSLREVGLEREGETLLESAGECLLLLEWRDAVSVSLEGLNWIGEGREIRATAEMAWPDRGRFSVTARGLTADLLSDFLNTEPADVRLSSAELEGSWNEEGPVEFRATAEVRMDIGDANDVIFEVSARGEREELHVERLRATSRGEVLAFAEGKLPVAVMPGHPDLLRIPGRGEIDFRAETDSRAHFWEEIGRLTGLRLEDPRLSLEIRGTTYEPAGQILASASLVDLQGLRNGSEPVPVLKDLHLETVFDPSEIRLEAGSIRIEDQRVEMEAALPMGSGEWRALVRDRVPPDWKRASGRIRISEAQVAAFTRFAPAVLSPQGTVNADLKILPGGFLDGIVTLDDVATRPLMPFGSIQDGTARLRMRGRTVQMEEISAEIGGERLTITGSIDLPFEQAFGFDVNLQGQNLPLARRPGVVIRGDLDLSASGREDEAPVLSGRVDLRDSFYLAHLRLMPTGSVATPERRPPFFSITEEPFNAWRLDVELRGPGFLNVSGPIFRGEISASFNLTGTLEEPRAIGRAFIDSGRVRFPFANMTIDQGEITLRRDDPFQPQLFIIASSMAFGYDLRMEITGTAETPIIEFTAIPPLTSEQALLMVTTGELPREEIRFTTQQRASRFAIYFGQNLLYELTGNDSAGDRLVIRSGEQVSEGGRETMAIEYKLNDRWSLVGEYDRFDEYNVGVKWNLYSR